jgi:hypothetical protein
MTLLESRVQATDDILFEEVPLIGASGEPIGITAVASVVKDGKKFDMSTGYGSLEGEAIGLAKEWERSERMRARAEGRRERDAMLGVGVGSLASQVGKRPERVFSTFHIWVERQQPKGGKR